MLIHLGHQKSLFCFYVLLASLGGNLIPLKSVCAKYQKLGAILRCILTPLTPSPCRPSQICRDQNGLYGCLTNSTTVLFYVQLASWPSKVSLGKNGHFWVKMAQNLKICPNMAKIDEEQPFLFRPSVDFFKPSLKSLVMMLLKAPAVKLASGKIIRFKVMRATGVTGVPGAMGVTWVTG